MLYYARSLNQGRAAGSTLAVSIPTSAVKAGTVPTITTNSIAATPSGGSGTYPTYLWTVTNQVGNKAVTIGSPNASGTTFSITGANISGDEGACDAICTVTDSLGAIAASNVSAVDITRL